MAKSARASTRKRNNANLRTKVFKPVEDARLARLSAKLQEIADAPKPETEKEMDVDGKEQEADPETEIAQDDKDEAMQWAAVTSSSKHTRGKKSFGKIVKKTPKRRVKAKSQMVFPSEIARKKRQSKTKKT